MALAKEEWEFNRLKELRAEEERRAELEEDEMLFTYSRQDAYNQVKKKSSKKGLKKMKKQLLEPLTSTPKVPNKGSSRQSVGSDGGSVGSSPESEVSQKASRATSRRSSVNSQASTVSVGSNKSGKIKDNVKQEGKKIKKERSLLRGGDGIKVEKVSDKDAKVNGPSTMPAKAQIKKFIKTHALKKPVEKIEVNNLLSPAEEKKIMTRARHASGEVLATTPTGMTLRKPLAINIQNDNGLVSLPMVSSPKHRTPIVSQAVTGKNVVMPTNVGTPKVNTGLDKTPKSTTTSQNVRIVPVNTPPRATLPSPGLSPVLPQPFSNPNLVIRTRRVPAKDYKKLNSEGRDSDSSFTEPPEKKVATTPPSVGILAKNSIPKSVRLPLNTVVSGITSLQVGARALKSTNANVAISPQTIRSSSETLVRAVSSINKASVLATSVSSAPVSINATSLSMTPQASTSMNLKPLASTVTLNPRVATSVHPRAATSVLGTRTISSVSGAIRLVQSSSPSVSANGKPGVMLVGGSQGIMRASTVGGTQTLNPNNTVPILEKMAMQLQGYNSVQQSPTGTVPSRPQQIIIVQSRPQQTLVQQQPAKVVTASPRPQQVLVRTQNPGLAGRPQQVYIQTRQGGQQVLVPLQTLTGGTPTSINLTSLQNLQSRAQVTNVALNNPPRVSAAAGVSPITRPQTITVPISALQGRAGGIQTVQTIRQPGTSNITVSPRQVGTTQVRQTTLLRQPQQFIVQQPGKQPQHLILPAGAAQQLLLQQSKQGQQVILQPKHVTSVVAGNVNSTGTVKFITSAAATNAAADATKDTLDTG